MDSPLGADCPFRCCEVLSGWCSPVGTSSPFPLCSQHKQVTVADAGFLMTALLVFCITNGTMLRLAHLAKRKGRGPATGVCRKIS